ncbi:YgdI/YgdR family lipoprotein [Orrella sp. JC864]|uniref:YgdI/YgdR family lipoprotein n=1 Tax=Orrella sp. JC864 TaxID=3120298 RepID=UPI00300A5669
MTLKMKTLTLTFVLAGAGLVAGCSSPSVITKTDGSRTVTSDEPDFDRSTGTYRYEENGRQVQVNKDRVDRVETLD